jgi:hypothetical protein
MKAHRRVDAADFPWFRVWLVTRQPCFSPRINPVRDFWFPVQTEQRRRWPQARIHKTREVLRFVSFAPHSLPTGGRCAQGISARASPKLFSKTCIFKGLAALLGTSRTKTRNERIHSLQASQIELAEPFKYSNTLHTSSTLVCCIPWIIASDNSIRSSVLRLDLVEGILPADSGVRKTAQLAEKIRSLYTGKLPERIHY